MRIKFIIIQVIVILCFLTSHGQEVDFTIPDFLKNSSYESIYESYMKVWPDTIKSEVYLNTWFQKATKEKNIPEKARALTLLSYYAKSESRKLKLLDNAILLTKDTDDFRYTILPYSFKGGYYHSQGSYQKSLENYLKALEFANRANNEEYIYITKHNIGILKIAAGKYDEAITLFRECLDYNRKTPHSDRHGKNQTFLGISEAYLKTKKLDSASIYIEAGLEKTKGTIDDLYYQFVLLKGINFFLSGNMNLAKSNIERAIFHIDKDDPNYTGYLILGNFYLGKINELSNNTDKAEYCFLEVDRLLEKNNMFYPEIREGYQFLIAHYQQKNNNREELSFTHKLSVYDSISKNDLGMLSSRLIIDFDTPMLLKEKEILIEELLDDKKNMNYLLQISLFVIIVVLIGLLFQYRKRKAYKNKFLEFIKEQDKSNRNQSAAMSGEELSANALNISPEIVNNVLNELKSFEQEKKFLNKDITSTDLARDLATNTKYLSQIINHHKKKSFSNYVKDLRINHAIKQLKIDSSLRNFTVQGIAQEMGFNSAESFSSAFRKETGMKPSYFIRELKNLQANDK